MNFGYGREVKANFSCYLRKRNYYWFWGIGPGVEIGSGKIGGGYPGPGIISGLLFLPKLKKYIPEYLSKILGGAVIEQVIPG